MGGTLRDTNDDEDMRRWNEDDTSSFIDVDYGDGSDDNDVRNFSQFDGEVFEGDIYQGGIYEADKSTGTQYVEGQYVKGRGDIPTTNNNNGGVSSAMMVDDVDWNEVDGTDIDWDGEEDTEWGDDDDATGERPLRTRRINIKRLSSDMDGNNRGMGRGMSSGMSGGRVGGISGSTSYSQDPGESSVVGINGAMDVSSLGGVEVIDTTADTITDGTEGHTNSHEQMQPLMDKSHPLIDTPSHTTSHAFQLPTCLLIHHSSPL